LLDLGLVDPDAELSGETAALAAQQFFASGPPGVD
jgi:hypothetical protein